MHLLRSPDCEASPTTWILSEAVKKMIPILGHMEIKRKVMSARQLLFPRCEMRVWNSTTSD